MPLTSEPCRPARTHGWTWIVPGKSTAHTTRPAPRAHSWAMTPYSPRGKATISEKPLSAIWFPSFLTYRARYQVPLTIIRGQRHGFNPTKDARPRRASRSRLRSRRCSRCLSEAMISSSTQWTVDQSSCLRDARCRRKSQNRNCRDQSCPHQSGPGGYRDFIYRTVALA
jgi:hypothetical protein